jgi:hypothetical protein
MNADRKENFFRICVHLRLSAALLLVLLGGCFGKPNQANIELRKQIQSLEAKNAELQRQHEADQATITGLKSQVGTIPTLPEDRLEKLYTVHGIQIGRLTGGVDLDGNRPGDEALKVQVVPTDDDGEPIKAVGSFVIEAFDLAAPDPRIGRWEIGVDEAKKSWFGGKLLYDYIFTLPWQQRVPQHSDLTVKVTFTDELTHRQFTAQRQVKVNPPPPPTTQVAG